MPISKSYARFKNGNKEHNQWVNVLQHVQYSENIYHQRGITSTRYSVHFGVTPPDFRLDMSLSREAVPPLET